MPSAGSAPSRAPRALAPGGGPAPEPLLAIGEIQGNVLPGFATGFQHFLFVEILDPGPGREWLSSLPLTTLAEVLGRSPGAAGADTAAWVNVALSYQGLRKVAGDADRLRDLPLKQGMARRSALLGDPPAPDAAGNPQNWLIGRPGQGLDAVVMVASDDHRHLSASADSLRRRLPPGVEIVFEQSGQSLQAPFARHEPFGFRDDISQPGVRGRLSTDPEDFLTLRENPDDPDQGKPGQNLIWPGEFVFGYPGQDWADKHRAGPVVGGGPSWSLNGSLLVFRRLRQDVEGFNAFLQSAATELSHRHPALAALTAEQLGAKLMGRWRSGAPVVVAPDADLPAVGGDPQANNHFAFAGAQGVAATAVSSARDGGDPFGLRCPHAAHIRRAYPRGAATAGLTEANIETHRLLRRGIAFGTENPPGGERGLLFLAYQTSIERQFEFITRAWLNNPHLQDTDDGHDPIVGQSVGTPGDRSRVFSIPVPTAGGSVERVHLDIPRDWVVPTGGEYFFVPSITMLRTLR